MTEPESPSTPETAWRGRPDRLRWFAVLVDLLLVAGLFIGSLLFLLPLTPHLEISSDSMDPFTHAWAIWNGRASPFSSWNLLYAWGRAWTALPLLVGAEGLEGIAARMAVATSCMAPCVYIAGRVLVGGTSPGAHGTPVRRVGAFLGPLVGAMLFVRFPGFLWSQVAGSHVYLSAEFAALGLLPAAVLLRTAQVGGGDSGPPTPWRGEIIAALTLGACIAMSTLNHPYGASQAGVLVPLGALLVARRGKRGLLLLGLAAGLAALMGLPHALHLALARPEMGQTFVEYARSDAEFGYLEWTRSFHRLTMARLESTQGWVMFWSPLGATVVGLAVLTWRPRLGAATAMVGSIGLSTAITELLLTRISQHIQPYHWHSLLPWAALSCGLAVASLLDVALRRSQTERIRDAERGRGLPAVVARRIPATLIALGMVGYLGEGVHRSLVEDRGFLENLWEISRPRQAFHHARVARWMLAEATDELGAAQLGGIDLPDYSVVLDPIALTFELLSRGEAIDEIARTPSDDETMLLHIGLGREEVDRFLDDLSDDVTLVRGDEDFLLLRGTTLAFRRWTRQLCHEEPGPGFLRGEDRAPYWPRGSLDTKHLVVGGEFYPTAYPWTHPCMAPFSWPDIRSAEYPLMPPETPPGELAASDKYVWAELGLLVASRTETTRRDWDKCVADGACADLTEGASENAPAPAPPETKAPEADPEAGWLPVVGVSPEQALAYCRWLADGVSSGDRVWTGDLPNSVEWEVLGSWWRGVSEVRVTWPWGDEPLPGAANAAGSSDGYEGLAPVGSFYSGRSPMSLDDMGGNAAEWVRRATRPTRDGDYPYGRSLPGFLLAGGSFRSDQEAMRNGLFEDPAPERPLDDVGFRCVIRGEDPP
ncbi:MAG: SUMF1/EgtB/PvdO family nonheme iron enzyme [Deltaproteobacteria bacterium]|nr:SUMF1/EgtB/PvdO family nonheme iron enzyme [Deltaproteobacteria bacterium]